MQTKNPFAFLVHVITRNVLEVRANDQSGPRIVFFADDKQFRVMQAAGLRRPDLYVSAGLANKALCTGSASGDKVRIDVKDDEVNLSFEVDGGVYITKTCTKKELETALDDVRILRQLASVDQLLCADRDGTFGKALDALIGNQSSQTKAPSAAPAAPRKKKEEDDRQRISVTDLAEKLGLPVDKVRVAAIEVKASPRTSDDGILLSLVPRVEAFLKGDSAAPPAAPPTAEPSAPVAPPAPSAPTADVPPAASVASSTVDAGFTIDDLRTKHNLGKQKSDRISAKALCKELGVNENQMREALKALGITPKPSDRTLTAKAADMVRDYFGTTPQTESPSVIPTTH